MALTQHGYQVHNFGYPSRGAPIEKLAAPLRSQICIISRDENKKIHFVTHSLGGIILRYLLKSNRPKNLGRVVMLAPPNQGAVLVDRFSGNRCFQWILGPVGRQLGTNPDSLPKRLGPVDYEVGIIAGNRSLNPLFSSLIPGPDDGRIAVEATKVDGMTDFVVVPCIHPTIMNCAITIKQTVNFVKLGCFHQQ
jgi:hypothetical protein